MINFGDGHNRLETPVLIPNTEVKLPMLVTVVPDKVPNHQAVFHFFLNMKKISKIEVKNKINLFFKNIKNKTSKDIKKIKKLAMSKNIPLKEKRKLFCKKCLNPYNKPKIRIKNKIKSIICNNCNYVSRWKI